MDSDRDEVRNDVRDGLRRAELRWPTPGQLVRQLGIVVVLAAVWGGALLGVVRMPATFVASGPEGPPSAARAARMAARAERDSAAARAEDALAAGDADDPADSAKSPKVATRDPAPPAKEPVAAQPEPPRQVASAPAPKPDPPAATDPPKNTSSARADPPAKTEAPTNRPSDVAARPAVPSPPATAPRETEAAREPRAKPSAETLALLMETPDSAAAEVSFARDVAPILERRCVQCHGGERKEGGRRIEEGLDLRTHKGLMLGSTWGTVIEAGDPVASYLLELVLSGEMPDEGPRLLPGEIRIIRNWILAGARSN